MSASQNDNTYRAMPGFSQGSHDDILFIKSGTDSNAVYDAATFRLDAVRKLLDYASQSSLEKTCAGVEMSAITDAAGILVTDAMAIMEGLRKKRPL